MFEESTKRQPFLADDWLVNSESNKGVTQLMEMIIKVKRKREAQTIPFALTADICYLVGSLVS